VISIYKKRGIKWNHRDIVHTAKALIFKEKRGDFSKRDCLEFRLYTNAIIAIKFLL
jgi:hypothetical protein